MFCILLIVCYCDKLLPVTVIELTASLSIRTTTISPTYRSEMDASSPFTVIIVLSRTWIILVSPVNFQFIEGAPSSSIPSGESSGAFPLGPSPGAPFGISPLGQSPGIASAPSAPGPASGIPLAPSTPDPALGIPLASSTPGLASGMYPDSFVYDTLELPEKSVRIP